MQTFRRLANLGIPRIRHRITTVLTHPRKILEDRGAWDGMRASKAFGRDKKASSLGAFLIQGLIFVVEFYVELFVTVMSSLPV